MWRSVEAVAKERNWRVALSASRKLDDLPNALSVPARLMHMEGYLAKRFTDRAPAWLPDECIEYFLDWEVRRWRKESVEKKKAKTGLMRLASYVDSVIHSLEPSVIVTSNKIEHFNAMHKLAADHYGIAYSFLERSATDGMLVEKAGMFAESDLWNQQLKLDVGSVDHSVRNYLYKNTDGFRAQTLDEFEPGHLGLAASTPIVFMPFDNTLWTGWAQEGHPQNPIDNPLFTTPADAIRFVSESMKEFGGHVLLKRHPADVEELPTFENVTEVSYSNSSLISAADVVVCFLTKLAFVAPCFGKPTLCLAPNPAAIGGATQLKTISSFNEAFDLALVEGFSTEQLDLHARYMKWYDESYSYACDEVSLQARNSIQLGIDLIDRVEIANPVDGTTLDRFIAGARKLSFR